MSEAAGPAHPHAILPAPIGKEPSDGEEVAIFALGCFWGAERKFWELPGVVSTAVGYIAGHLEAPDYHAVCTGTTGHTEAVRVVYRPIELRYDALLTTFWNAHDPTQGNRQGNDIGSQYRSGIYTTSEAQKQSAENSRATFESALASAGRSRITTEILPATKFWLAEEYHQQYLHKNPNGYCGLGGCGVWFPE